MLTKHTSITILFGFISAAIAATKPAKALDYVGQLAAEIEPTRVVVYKKVGDRELHLNIFEPEGFQRTDRRPCFLTIHGGGRFHPCTMYDPGFRRPSSCMVRVTP